RSIGYGLRWQNSVEDSGPIAVVPDAASNDTASNDTAPKGAEPKGAQPNGGEGDGGGGNGGETKGPQANGPAAPGVGPRPAGGGGLLAAGLGCHAVRRDPRRPSWRGPRRRHRPARGHRR